MKTKAAKNTDRKKPGKKTLAGRQAIKRAGPGRAGGIDLLRIADKVGLQQYAAEGFRDNQSKAMAILAKMDDGPTADLMKKDPILMAQFIRERGGMPPEEIFAAIDSFVEETAWEDRELNRLSAAIDAMYKAYGAKDDEHWPVGEGPEEFEKLRTAFDDRFRQLKLAILYHYAENEMADLLLNDPAAYADRVKKGQKIHEKNRAAGKYSGKVNDDKAR